MDLFTSETSKPSERNASSSHREREAILRFDRSLIRLVRARDVGYGIHPLFHRDVVDGIQLIDLLERRSTPTSYLSIKTKSQRREEQSEIPSGKMETTYVEMVLGTRNSLLDVTRTIPTLTDTNESFKVVERRQVVFHADAIVPMQDARSRNLWFDRSVVEILRKNQQPLILSDFEDATPSRWRLRQLC